MLKDSRDLPKKVGDLAPGTTVELGIIRQGEKKTVTVTLGELPGPRAEHQIDNGSPLPEGSTDPSTLGFSVAPVPGPQAAEGVMVTKIDPQGIAAERGLQEGDVILNVAGDSVNSPTDLPKALSDARRKNRHNAVARVRTGDATHFVAIPVG
jgi:serine protease Do